MSDGHIRLLPELVANQIAAGEVIQRPASVVKELLENSLDACSNNVNLIIKDAGKQLIQVIDDGVGMNEIDLRMSIERHATSKIYTIDDLFRVSTYGFRGEALASIVSVARVEILSRTSNQQIGSRLVVEGSNVLLQEPIHHQKGTAISVKNLFFNVPARRQFLKSNAIETRHIYDEFYRIAIPNYEVNFTFTENDILRYKLDKTNLKQRIIQIFGSSYQKRLIPIQQKTPYIEISGFIIHPQYARKQRGEQFFFVNNRFIKSLLLHRVLSETMKEFIPVDTYPGYFIFINIDSQEIDLNVHPTKTEINFRDELHIATILKSAIQYALAHYHVMPSLDFQLNPDLEQIIWQKPQKPLNIPELKYDPNYNPFEKEKTKNTINKDSSEKKQSDYLKITYTSSDSLGFNEDQNSITDLSNFILIGKKFLCLHNPLGLLVINVEHAMERIIYNNILETLNNSKAVSSQQLLHPEIFQLSVTDGVLFAEIIPELENIGFRISDLGGATFSCTAIPTDLPLQLEISKFMEQILESYKDYVLDTHQAKNIFLAKTICKKLAARMLNLDNQKAVSNFLNNLFNTSMPDLSPSGKRIFNIITHEQLSKLIEQI